jgi:hypothetical protein
LSQRTDKENEEIVTESFRGSKRWVVEHKGKVIKTT